MNADLTILIGLGSLFVVSAGIYISQAGKYFTIREHQEFSNGVIQAREALRTEVRRELDQMHRRIEVIEMTRPTTGELLAQITAQVPPHPIRPKREGVTPAR